MTALQIAQLNKLVRRYGFRMSNLDAQRAGVRESVLSAAVSTGRAKVERASFCGTSADGAVVVTYVVFA